jgi:hypothetical protein
MSDEIDAAFVQEEAYRAAALNRRQASLPAAGICYACGERVAGAMQRFCDAECREDWERTEAARRRNGRVEG